MIKMSLAIDAVILFSGVIIIWLGAKRGFFRSFMGLISGVASIIAAYAYSPVLAAYIKQNYLIERVTSGIAETLRSLAFDVDTDKYNLDKLAIDLPEPFTEILDRYHIDIDAFSEKIRGLTGCSEDIVNGYAEQIAEPTVDLISSVLAFAAIFIIVVLALSILTAILNLIFNLPVLRGANIFFGTVLGAVEAVVLCGVLATVLSVLVSSLGAIDPSVFGADTIDETVICSFILKHNPAEILMTKLGW